MLDTKYFKHFACTGGILEMSESQFNQALRNAIRISANHGVTWKRIVTADTTYYYFYSKYTHNTLVIYSIEKPIN